MDINEESGPDHGFQIEPHRPRTRTAEEAGREAKTPGIPRHRPPLPFACNGFIYVTIKLGDTSFEKREDLLNG